MRLACASWSGCSPISACAHGRDSFASSSSAMALGNSGVPLEALDLALASGSVCVGGRVPCRRRRLRGHRRHARGLRRARARAPPPSHTPAASASTSAARHGLAVSRRQSAEPSSTCEAA